MECAVIVASLSLFAWIVLLLLRGRFWLVAPKLARPAAPGASNFGLPGVVAVIPARNEADILPTTLPTVVAQDYSGPFRVIVVDDRSEDATGEAARAAVSPHAERLSVLSGEVLPDGWSGKVWALAQGVAAACAGDAPPRYLWFTDADIEHDAWVLAGLVARAEDETLDLVSVMATLQVDTRWDRLLVPAFVYFFAKLYPFRLVADARRRTAGAAGGCVLVRSDVLARAGGLASMRGAIIDDCTLARRVKDAEGRLWLGYSRGVRSVRGYGSLASVWNMVARSAYTQLGHSPWLLAGTILGMLFLYAVGPAALAGGAVAAALGVPGACSLAALGGTTWAAMALSFVPLLRHHGVTPFVAPLLPVAGVLYTAMTVSSALRHARGRGGAWKGRTY
ncbi:MAG: glycosyltransferase [Candidatus Bipolaricaulota bacterium]